MTSAMFREAAEAPAVVTRQLATNRDLVRELAKRLKERPPRAVVTVARGSSDNAATYAKYLIETRLGILTASAAPSISSVYDRYTDMRNVLVLAISQSGKSPDLLASLEHAQDAGGFIVGLVNTPGSPLEQIADITLPLCAGPEISIAATKSFVAAVAALANLIAVWSGNQRLTNQIATLPELLSNAWDCDWSTACRTLRAAHNMFVVGRGIGFAIAQEAALKLKETCGLHAEGFSAAEVLHGPMALVKPEFPILIFSQEDQTRSSISTMASRFAEADASLLIAGFHQDGAIRLPTLTSDPTLEPLLMVQSFYRLAEELARARGLNPDAPPHLKKITETV
jgi:glucosamine--fructose-6-phosphate aminotransferase (isomerizing)